MNQNTTFSQPHAPYHVFGSKPLGAYGLGSAGAADAHDQDGVIDALTEQYGARLERMDTTSKHLLRASLSLYLCWLHKLMAQQAPIPETLIDEAIDQVDPDCWQGNTEIDTHIAAIATLPVGHIEALLDALTAQLRHDQVLVQEAV
jgi:hypothetical protein